MRRPFTSNRDFWPLLIVSIASLAAVLVVAYREYTPEWRHRQEAFRQYLLSRGAYAAAAAVPNRIEQIWVPALDRVDRCISCHVNYDGSISNLPDLPPLYQKHPDLPYMSKHPFPSFGCTACHGGQGFATDEAGAHGLVKGWDDPLLSTALAAKYGLTREQLMQIKCNTCHRPDDMTPGMDLIDMGKELFAKKRCVSCHGFEGGGGLGASDLTYDGDKNPELLPFSKVEGLQTALNWQIQHFLSPQKVVHRSGMPNYRLTKEQAKALALLMVSWRKFNFPPQYLPAARKQPPAVGPLVRELQAPPPATGALAKQGRYVFENRGCNTCHRVGGGTLIGPDLTGITLQRDDRWLSTWLKDPAAVVARDPKLEDWTHGFGDIIMPNQNLDDNEIKALIAYMKEFPAQQPAPKQPPKS